MIYDNKNLDIEKELLKFQYGIGMYDKVEYIHDFKNEFVTNATYGIYHNSGKFLESSGSSFIEVTGVDNFVYTNSVGFNGSSYVISTYGPSEEGIPNPMKGNYSITDDNKFSVMGDLRANGRNLKNMNVMYCNSFEGVMEIRFNVFVPSLVTPGETYGVSKTFRLKRLGPNLFDYAELIGYNEWSPTRHIKGNTGTDFNPLHWHGPPEMLPGTIVAKYKVISNDMYYQIYLDLHVNENNDEYYLTTCINQRNESSESAPELRIYVDNSINIIKDEGDN